MKLMVQCCRKVFKKYIEYRHTRFFEVNCKKYQLNENAGEGFDQRALASAFKHKSYPQRRLHVRQKLK